MKGVVIRLETGWWTKERLMYYTSKLFNLTTKPGSATYRLNSRLCDLAMAKFSNSNVSISLEVLDEYLKSEMLKLLDKKQEKIDMINKKGTKIYRF